MFAEAKAPVTEKITCRSCPSGLQLPESESYSFSKAFVIFISLGRLNPLECQPSLFGSSINLPLNTVQMFVLFLQIVQVKPSIPVFSF